MNQKVLFISLKLEVTIFFNTDAKRSFASLAIRKWCEAPLCPCVKKIVDHKRFRKFKKLRADLIMSINVVQTVIMVVQTLIMDNRIAKVVCSYL